MSTVSHRSSSPSNEPSIPGNDPPPAVAAESLASPELAQLAPLPHLSRPQRPSTDEPPTVTSQAPPSAAQSQPYQPPRAQTATARQNPQNHSLLHSFLGHIGYGRRGTLMRRHFTILACKMALAIGQIAAIVTLTTLSTHRASPIYPTQSQWDACDKPLGPWAILWAVRVGLGSFISLYSWHLVKPGLTEYVYDPENHINEDAIQGQQTPPPIGGLNGPGQPRHIHAGRVRPTPAFVRSLTTLLSALTLVWFIASHILVYTSLSTCRHSSPYLWWLNFGLMCIAYLVILEMIVAVVFLFFIVPLLFLIVNLVLLCLGRQPLINNNGIGHEIGKLPKQLVDRIPLVMYIPPPPAKEPKESLSGPPHVYPPKASHDAIFSESTTQAHPVQNLATSVASPEPEPRRRHRFALFRSSKKTKESDLEAGTSQNAHNGLTSVIGKRLPKRQTTEDEWEANWEKGEYPFVKLPNNRATCAICLVDFEAPPKKGTPTLSTAIGAVSESSLQSPGASGSKHSGKQKKTRREKRVQVENLQLEDAGEGAQPLRLLACGHAFHQTCLDPWLTDVSGRCPVCQRAVDVEELRKLTKKGNTSWATDAPAPGIPSPRSSGGNENGQPQ